jgi:hypothetical protein
MQLQGEHFFLRGDMRDMAKLHMILQIVHPVCHHDCWLLATETRPGERLGDGPSGFMSLAGDPHTTAYIDSSFVSAIVVAL